MKLRDETHLPQFKIIKKTLLVLLSNVTRKRFRWDMSYTIGRCNTLRDLYLCRDAINSVLAWERKLC